MTTRFHSATARKQSLALLLFLAGSVTAAAPSSAQQYLDVTSLTTGTGGSFTGALNGVAVTGTITANDGSFQFFPTGTGFNNSTINNTSPQFSYSNIYSPATALTDRIGYQKDPSGGTATVTITFASAITNPVFQVANLDGMVYDFTPTSGLGGLALLSGNGGTDGDGLGVVGKTIVDRNPNTLAGIDPATPPPTAGARSAYGSVRLLGTFTTLTFNAVTNTSGDSGSFTFSAAPVPEPGSVALLIGISMTGMGFLARRKRSRRSA